MKKTISIIGAGHLGTSIIRKLVGNLNYNIIATRRSQGKLQELKTFFPSIIATNDNAYATSNADIIILATKSSSFEELSTQIKDLVKDKLVISLCPLTSLATLESLFSSKVLRVITPCDPGEDIICYTKNENVTNKDEVQIRSIFGDHVLHIQEKQMPLATTFTLLRGVLNSYVDPLLHISDDLPEDTQREIVGNMFISLGEEIREGKSAQERLSNASGGMNKESFTLRFFEKLQVSQKMLVNEMRGVYKVFRER